MSSKPVSGSPDMFAGELDDNVELSDDLKNGVQEQTPPETKTPDEAVTDDADESVDQDDGSGDEGEDEGTEEAPKVKKPKQKASERIKELNAKLREAERNLEQEREKSVDTRIERLEKLLNGGKNEATVEDSRVSPDPNDLSKYPLGRLDDRYIEDQIAYTAEKMVEQQFGSFRQRQADDVARAAAEQQTNDLLEKVSTITDKGLPIFDDFMETVVEPGMKGEYQLTQVTFEAAVEAEHGAEVLHALATNKAEAARVANLSPYQQIRYVTDKSTEIASKRKAKPPRAGAPPQHQSRGSSGKFGASGDTDDLEAFEKEWNRR